MGLFGEKKEIYKDKKSIIIYFSRADENYFGGTVTNGLAISGSSVISAKSKVENWVL